VRAIDDVLGRAAACTAGSWRGPLPILPALRLAVVTCMDARIDPYTMFGLAPGDAHLLRNAGGLVSEDVLRSLAVSQRVVGTREVMVIHHTDCGMFKVGDDEFREALEAEIGIAPPWAVEVAPDVDEQVRRSVAAIARSPFIPHREVVRGFVFQVEDGVLREVEAAAV